ncbi:TetR/AcrR family transcriptional regulator [Deinococcus sp. KSM4-11]|uniref:TetR/AcrR family transcriptional regulator n=1 Tax=Deinococcus sp. KSM4-11 TaxID=2568654 RepID=UPI0010A3B8C3|nr:TetR/AcrR family transcriptional regulator [Deinococcus sp. KSM4-11]THF87299.1 TetR/AcrR family transcriptional regulator [Deinococcus sp. KSM4-11]
MPLSAASPRERILHAALTLLEEGGVDAVSTRSVSAAARVQAPTIYRLYGSMQGLLDAVAGVGYASYMQIKEAREPGIDPVADLQAGWDAHVAFGLAHPHLYTLMYSAPVRPGGQDAAQQGAELLRRSLRRVATEGRLGVSVERAAALLHASAVGVTLTLLGAPERDRHLAATMRDTILTAILAPPGAELSDASPAAQVAAHAVALAALLPELNTTLSAAERTLLLEWLGRLADSR